jgi:ABC-type Co2+ transport system permease subunit
MDSMVIEQSGNDPGFWAIALAFAVPLVFLVALLFRLAPRRSPPWPLLAAACLVAVILIAAPRLVQHTIERTFSEPGVFACAHFLRGERYLPSVLGGVVAVALVVKRMAGAGA